jgi:AraC-like DNA-binding protein
MEFENQENREQDRPRQRGRNPELLRMLGVTEEDMRNPGAALTSAGVEKMFAILKAMEMPLEEEDGRMIDRPPQEKRTPVWQAITGMTKESEGAMGPRQREEALQVLVNVVLKFLRYEMQAERENPCVYHTVFWDPLQKVCSALGIARAQLSRLSREATGLSAHELVDGIRAESVREKMKESVTKVVELLRREHKKEALSVREVWNALREARRGPQFHRGQWALGYGFPNYLRFYRACLFYYKLAPQQLELSIIEELVGEKTAEAEPAQETDTENAHVDPFLRVMKRREVQFFTELSALVWKEAMGKVRAAG